MRALAKLRCAAMASAFRPTMSLGRPGEMHLARADHRRDAAIEKGFDPAELVLARRPVAEDRMHMAVHETRRNGAAHGVDDGSARRIGQVLQAADGRDAAVLDQDRIGVQDRIRQVAREHQADVTDDRFALGRSRRRFERHALPPCPWGEPSGRAPRREGAVLAPGAGDG